MTVSVPSASVASAVTPTAVPLAALSETELAEAVRSGAAPATSAEVAGRWTVKL